jgi:hypothetical protein
MFYNLKIGSFNCRYTPLKPIERDFPYCNNTGEILTRKVKVKGEYVFIDDNGKEYPNAFKLINGKPMAKLQKTKEVTKYKEVDKKEVEDLLVEKEYLVECETLYNELSNSEKALKFGICFGNGFKVYKAYIHKSELYNNLLFMSVGTTQKSEIIQEIVEIQKQNKKAQQIELVVQGIDRAKVEDLIEI